MEWILFAGVEGFLWWAFGGERWPVFLFWTAWAAWGIGTEIHRRARK